MLLSPTVAYALGFALAGLVCLGGIARARQIEDAGTRRGLVALLATSGGWAVAHAVLLVLPGRGLKTGVYLVGLILGFSTVFAWLYFCSAYTGRFYHRRPAYRQAAVLLYLFVVGVKVTNPYHHLYFTTMVVAEPFPHLAIQQGLFHWIVTGLSYTLAAVGMFALFETFVDSEYDATPLAGLVGIAGLPVVLDIVGYATPYLIDMIHAPLGVAAFALGVLFVFEDRFFAVQLTEGVEGPTVFLDREGRIREYNRSAEQLFPDLSAAAGSPVDAVPALADALASDADTVSLDVDGDRRHFVVSENSFEVGQGSLGRILVFSDVTALERQRRELERHNRQLEDLAGGMRHELRNAVTIVRGNVEWAMSQLESGEVAEARDALRTATNTTDRTTRLMNDFATLAQYGRTVTHTKQVDVAATARAAWPDAADATLTVDTAATVEAEPGRLELLFERAFEFALDNGASTVTVEDWDDGITITDDGEPPQGDTDRYFDYDDAVSNETIGTSLPMVRTLARVHGWGVTLDGDYRDGIRLVLTWD
ncbi:His Kinase A (phospho-acceptor) domain-containing protein [Haloplanus vescus]|uniref:His Kinase A (Phospho-acceptor) domain-containing protein n=1 Tax=Haloplanus vescus TaxID=555874 RepID=A0A1H3WVE5_9EURY|nr:histidine kinase N-terminal 7TM domain-containing protein [Haloplanus vescus]SDZ91135.1 His Kinase A (phospho-acceptor) domain-containing protein [Haloplanus vescus]